MSSDASADQIDLQAVMYDLETFMAICVKSKGGGAEGTSDQILIRSPQPGNSGLNYFGQRKIDNAATSIQKVCGFTRPKLKVCQAVAKEQAALAKMKKAAESRPKVEKQHEPAAHPHYAQYSQGDVHGDVTPPFCAPYFNSNMHDDVTPPSWDSRQSQRPSTQDKHETWQQRDPGHHQDLSEENVHNWNCWIEQPEAKLQLEAEEEHVLQHFQKSDEFEDSVCGDFADVHGETESTTESTDSLTDRKRDKWADISDRDESTSASSGATTPPSATSNAPYGCHSQMQQMQQHHIQSQQQPYGAALPVYPVHGYMLQNVTMCVPVFGCGMPLSDV
jgi:hypothetical protein